MSRTKLVGFRDRQLGDGPQFEHADCVLVFRVKLVDGEWIVDWTGRSWTRDEGMPPGVPGAIVLALTEEAVVSHAGPQIGSIIADSASSIVDRLLDRAQKKGRNNG